MNKNVQKALLTNCIIISILILMCTGLCLLTSSIPYYAITLILRIGIIGITGFVISIMIFYFLLYWWSEVKWDNCKYKYHSWKRKVFNK